MIFITLHIIGIDTSSQQLQYHTHINESCSSKLQSCSALNNAPPPQYLAPEVLQNSSHVKSSDVYSFGKMMV